MTQDTDMDEQPSVDARRERSTDHDRRHRFFRFEPTVSMGMVLQLVVFAVGMGTAYGTYREDQAKIRAEIAQLQGQRVSDREDLKSAVTDMKSELRDVRTDVREINHNLASIDNAVRTVRSR